MGCASQAASTMSVEATSGQVKMLVSVAKPVYSEAEPIVATVTIVNESAGQRRLAEPNWDFASVEFEVLRISGGGEMPARWSDCKAGLPKDYGWDFEPGEARSADFDLQSLFTAPLPTGRYALRATYVVPEYLKTAWHGRLNSPRLEFTVAVPSGVNSAGSKAARQWKRAHEDKAEAIKLAATYHSLSDARRGGDFAPYAGYYESEAYKAAGDRAKSLEVLREYAQTHKAVPFYGRYAQRFVATALLDQGDYAGARAAFAALPDSYEKRHWLKLCDLREENAAVHK